MELMDYHSHHYRCAHARGSIEDYIEAAIEKGLSEIGISDHFPFAAATSNPKLKSLPKSTTMSMTEEEFPEYIQEIKDLRDQYSGRIKVRISTEVGFVTSGKHLDRQKALLEPVMDDLDYLLCAIHDVKLDGHPPIFINMAKGAEILATHGEDRIHLAYIQRLRDMVECGYFDIVAHLDNHKLLWLPDEPVYSEAVWRELLEVLDLIKAQGMAVEINTSGPIKGALSQFPSDNIVKALIERDIPLTLSSDAHRPQNIAYQFQDFIDKARRWELTHLCTYEKRKQRLVPVD